MLWASLAAAQTPVLNPSFLEFNASADHSATGPAGPAVTRYDLEFYNIGAASPFQTNPLGKPTPNGSGVIRVDLSTIFGALPTGVTYEARVAAVGPGGTGRSTLSNQFAFTNPCAPTISPTGTSVGSAAGTGTVTVTNGSGCAWTAVSNAAWVSITGGASGSGNGSVSYSVAANTTPAVRTGALTIAGQTFSISQAAGCTFTISPTSLSVTSGNRTGTVSVTAGTACAWTASSAASWITVTSGASGSGNGTVGYSIAANTSISSRTGVVTIAGQAFTVTQGGVPCTATLSPTGVSVAPASTTGTIAVSIPAGCAWTAADDASWVSITSGASGSGSGTVAYSITANPNITQRTATITVAGQSFGITQAGVVCSTTISPTASSPTHVGGSGTVAVTANAASCPWTATSNAPWITVTGGASGTGSGTVSYGVAANTMTVGRTGTLSVAGQTLTVTQAAAPCTYSISPTQASVGHESSSNTIAITAPAGCAWTATESVGWISITNGASGTGNGTVTYSVAANAGITMRSADLTVAAQTFSVSQAGQPCSYALSPAGASVAAGATTGSVSVTALGGCTWTATSSTGWITITAGASGNGNGSVAYAVAANQTTSPRNGTLTIAGQAFTITQAGGACTYTASPASQSFGAAGGPGTVTVTAQSGCAWTGTTSAPWITITSGTGSGSGSFGYQVTANTAPTPRSGTIAVGGQVVTISQTEASCIYTLTPSSVSVGAAVSNGSFAVAAAAGCGWTATSGAAWLTVTGSGSGSGNGTIGYSAAANTAAAVRTATITVAGQTFTVTQAGAPCAFSLSTTSLDVSAPATSGTVSVTAGAGCSWTAVSAASWIVVTSGASGSGTGNVSLSIAANPGGGSRTGTITIAGQMVTVTQQGVACTTTLSPSSVSVPEGVTSGTVNISSPAACPWTAVSNTAWITIDSGATGTGAGAVSYTISANTAATVRTGTITIGGQTFTVGQSGRSCLVGFNPSSATIGASGGGYTVDVTIATGCTWAATSSQPWITIASGGSGTGPGTIGFAVDANPGLSVRTGMISVAGGSFQISQVSSCSYSVSPTSVSAGAGAASVNVFVFTAAGCSWTATSNAPWLTVTSGSGTGGGTVTLSASANTTGAPRTGTATVAGHTFVMNQNACNYAVSPASVSASAGGTSSNAFISTTLGCGWSASSGASWITLANGNSGTGTGWLNYTVAPNPNPAPRTGTLSIAGRTLTVNQLGAPCTFTVDPSDITVPKPGGTVTVTVETASGCSWSVQNTLNWVTVTGGTGTGSGTVTLQVAANTLAFARVATMYIAGELVIINQTTVIPPPSVPGNFRVVPNP